MPDQFLAQTTGWVAVLLMGGGVGGWLGGEQVWGKMTWSP